VWAANSSGTSAPSQSGQESPLSPWPWALQLEPLLSWAPWGHLQWLRDALTPLKVKLKLGSSSSVENGEEEGTGSPGSSREQEEGMESESERGRWVAATVGVWVALVLLVSSLSLGPEQPAHERRGAYALRKG